MDNLKEKLLTDAVKTLLDHLVATVHPKAPRAKEAQTLLAHFNHFDLETNKQVPGTPGTAGAKHV